MKNHDEMYKSLLSRYSDYQEKKKRKIIIAKRTLSLAACFAVIFSGYHVWQNVPKTPQNPPVIDESATNETNHNTPNTESTETSEENSQTTSAQVSEETHTTQTTYSDSSVNHSVTETQTTGSGAVHSQSQTVVQHQTQSQPITTQIRTEQTKPLQTTVHTTIKPQVTHTVTQTKPVKTTTHTTTQPQTTHTAMQTKPAQTTVYTTANTPISTTTRYENDNTGPMASGIVQTTTTENLPTGGMPATTTISVPMPGGSFENQFKIIENVSYNGKIWNKLIFTGSDTGSSHHEHSFDVAGFTVSSYDQERQQISLKHETGLTLSINYRDYDDFFIYCNPNMNNYYLFYEVNGKKVVREQSDSESDKNLLHPEYTAHLTAWEDGSHVFWTVISENDYPLLENLIADQTTY